MARKDFAQAIQLGPVATLQDRSTGPLRRVSDLALEHLVFVGQPRQIIPPALLQHLVDQGRNHPPDVLKALQSLAASDETSQRILDGLAELAATIRPPGKVHAPILCYRDGETWVVYDGHRRALASLLAGRNTVPAIEVTGRTDLDRDLDRIAIATARADWTAVELARELQRTRDRLRAEWAGKTPAEVGLEELVASETPDDAANRELSLHVQTEPAAEGVVTDAGQKVSLHVQTEPAAEDIVTDAGQKVSLHVQTKPLSGRRLTGLVTEVLMRRTGLGRAQYYFLLALVEKLSPEAQAVAQQARLTEGQLRPVTQITDPVRQLACVKGIVRHGLTSSQADVLVEGVQEGAKPAAAAARVARGDPEPERYDESSACRPVHPHQTLLAQPPKHLSRRSRRHWHDLHRARAKWDWVALDPDAAVKWVQELPAADVRALYDEARETAAAFVHLAEQIHEYGCG